MTAFSAIYEKHGDEWVASVIELPGALSQGKSLDEARENLRDAVRELLLARYEMSQQDVADASEVVRETIQIDLGLDIAN